MNSIAAGLSKIKQLTKTPLNVLQRSHGEWGIIFYAGGFVLIFSIVF